MQWIVFLKVPTLTGAPNFCHDHLLSQTPYETKSLLLASIENTKSDV